MIEEPERIPCLVDKCKAGGYFKALSRSQLGNYNRITRELNRPPGGHNGSLFTVVRLTQGVFRVCSGYSPWTRARTAIAQVQRRK